jgi:pyruvate dehydrogenase E2 component (dihydrolipoamide acetyltransferase)
MSVEFKLPDLGEGLTEAEIRKWLVRVGDHVERDQPLVEIETDKAVVELPSPGRGTVLSIQKSEGAVAKVGEVLVSIGGVEGAVAAPVEGKKASVSVVGELPEYREKPAPVTPQGQRVLATPAVRKLARDRGIDIAGIKGTGPGGRVTEDDLAKAQPAEAKPKMEPKFDLYGFVERQPLRGIRRTTARRMVESQTRAAQVTAMDVADVTGLVELRRKWKEALKEKGMNITYMPFVIKAVVQALKSNPILNSTLDDEKEEIIIKRYYNIGFAVATEEGLIVPVLKAADQKSITEIAEELERLVEKASSREIDLADLKGGTFTITNYGVFGGTYGTPIINYPETAILGTGRIAETPMVVGGEVKIRNVLYLSLTFDHRVMDGAEAARFMNELKRYLEDPDLLLISLN